MAPRVFPSLLAAGALALAPLAGAQPVSGPIPAGHKVPCPPAPCAPTIPCPPRVIVHVPQPQVEFRTVPADCSSCAPAHPRLPLKHPCTTCAPAPATAPAAPQMVMVQPATVAPAQVMTYVQVQPVQVQPVQVQQVQVQAVQVQPVQVQQVQPVQVQPVQVQPVQVQPVQVQPVQVQPVQVQPVQVPQAAEVTCPEHDLRIAAALIARARQNMAAQPKAATVGAAQMAATVECPEVCERLKRIEERLNLYGKAIDRLIADQGTNPKMMMPPVVPPGTPKVIVTPEMAPAPMPGMPEPKR